MTGWRRWLRMASILAVILVVYFTVPISFDLQAGDVAQLVISLLALSLLAVAVLVEVRHQLIDSDRRIDGLVLAMMISVLGFALGFYAMSQRDPTQIVGIGTRLDSLYFTMTTLLTIGFGDIYAEGQAARLLVLIQMVFNVVIIATAASTITNRLRTQAEIRAEAHRAAVAEGLVPPRRHTRRRHRNPT